VASANGYDATGPPTPPPPISYSPLRRLAVDLVDEVRAGRDFPPGSTNFSLGRTHQVAHDPLPLLLEHYERFGPIFTMRLLHSRVVFMLGPEANHFVTVSHPEHFHWREGSFIGGRLEVDLPLDLGWLRFLCRSKPCARCWAGRLSHIG